jgi:hypothetical protein
MTKNLILTQSRMMVARIQRRMAVLTGRSMRGAGYKFRGSIFDRIHDLNIYKKMGRHTRQQLFSRFIVSTHSLGMKYPKKRYVQGVRPAHIVFSEFSSPRRCRCSSCQAESVVADGEWFPRQVEVSKYDSFIFSKQTSPNKSKGRMN